jgi:hypothetical protein
MNVPFESPHHAPGCPVCDGTRLYYLFSVGTDRIVRCDDCGLLLAPGRPARPDERRAGAPSFEVVLDQLARRSAAHAGSMWLDSRVPGELATGASRTGFTVETGNAEALGAGAPLDVVVLGDRLNHASAPTEVLARAHARLRPGGVLVTWTPPLEHWCGGVLPGRRSPAVEASGTFYFDPSTLQSALFRAGFRHLFVSTLDGKRLRRSRHDAGCIVIAESAPKRPQPVLSVIVAIYNEAATAEAALEQITSKRVPGLDLEFIIVESNSTDGTREIVQRYAGRPGVRVVLEDRPRGKGHAVRTGLQAATGDFVLIQDADLEYDLEDYDCVLEPLRAGRTAFVLGARHGGQTWKIRRFNDQPGQALLLNLAHRGFTALINLSLGLRLSDPFTMYKVFRHDCLHGLTLECNRFDFDWELLIKLVRKGYAPLEIPVNYRSRSFKEGKKIRMFRDPLTWLRAWAKARFGPLQRR